MESGNKENTRPRLLVLLSRIPYPLDKGDKRRAFHQVEEFSKYFDVYLFALNDQKEIHPDTNKVMQSICKEFTYYNLSRFSILLNMIRSFFNMNPYQVGYFFNKGIQQQLHQEIFRIQPNHIFCQLLRTAEYVRKLPFPKTLDYQDAFSKGVHRRLEKAVFPVSIVFKSEYNRLINYERDIFYEFDYKTIITETDRDLIQHPQTELIKIIRNGVDLEYFKPINNSHKEHSLVFSGNMNYPPNIDCAKYIVEDIIPLVRSSFPDKVKLLLAGANPHKSLRAMESDSVKVSGWVDDLRPCYSQARIFIAPMRIGIGLQNKLLEAMAMGIPCITSPLANNPLGGTHMENILVANNAQECANYIDLLLNDKDLYDKLALNGRQFVIDNYEWAAATKPLIDLMLNDETSA